jgi:hypothetical protein
MGCSGIIPTAELYLNQEEAARAAPNSSPADSENTQSATLPPDVLDAISEALSDALVTEILAELLGNSQSSEPTVDSPRGSDHAA